MADLWSSSGDQRIFPTLPRESAWEYQVNEMKPKILCVHYLSMCACMNACAWGARGCGGVRGQNITSGIPRKHLPRCLFEMVSHQLSHTEWQGCLTPPPQCWDYKQAAPCLAFFFMWVLGIKCLHPCQLTYLSPNCTNQRFFSQVLDLLIRALELSGCQGMLRRKPIRRQQTQGMLRRKPTRREQSQEMDRALGHRQMAAHGILSIWAWNLRLSDDAISVLQLLHLSKNIWDTWSAHERSRFKIMTDLPTATLMHPG